MNLSKCLDCGEPLPPATRRPRLYCNSKCKFSYYRKNIREREEHQQRGQRHRRTEWFSPQDIVDRARRVMGGIDLDPASCVQANEIVRAAKYYDQSADGLLQPWRGRVWLNPPYDTFAPKFFAKFCEEYEAGGIPMALLLLGVHHLTTRWFQRIDGFAAIACLPAGRLKFSGRLAIGNPPMHGSVIIGFGVNHALFEHEFGEIGMIWTWQAKAVSTAAPAPLVLVSGGP